MKKLQGWLQNEESGQAMVEYAIIIALISVVAIISLNTIGKNLVTKFEKIDKVVNPPLEYH